ncbi:S8 family serine peptidase [Streptomyces sp. DSM 44917]|uniref:S8 family serine peptidase n=1 Tax=Streptomyces boetiae TaxID=3075541 RepID=A0ABU2LFG1_9ACTN|nr:S8 family serine peptidase [Streptomyces sp. DSM 44917]MDT0310325.1 S8 family serine peptidase [Streptomyces sp. DSM 44917]
MLAVVLACALGWLGLATPGAHADVEDRPWYLETLRAEEIWQETRGEGVTVAVIDSGVDASRPELAGRVLEGTDLTAGAQGAHVDIEGHGTTMAGLIAGSGAGNGVRGLAPGVSILPVRMMTDSETLTFGGDLAMAQGIEYAVEQGARVINIAVTPGFAPGSSPEMDAAVAEAARQGVLIFAAVGNQGTVEDVSFAADRPGVVGVAATDEDARRLTYSNAGSRVMVAAPGSDIPVYCDWPDGELCPTAPGGTSAASALVSASAALVWSAHPEWTKNQVLRALLETAERPDGAERDDETGYGMVRPDRVILDGEGDPGEPDVSPLFADYEAGLDPPATPAPRPESPDAEPSGSPLPQAGTGEGDSGSWPWIGLLGLAIAGGLGTVVWAVRRRRRPGIRA